MLVLAERDAQNVLGFTEAGEELCYKRSPRATAQHFVALTRPPDAEPGTLLLARGGFHYAPRYAVEVVDRIGGRRLVGSWADPGPARRRSRSGDPSRRICGSDRTRHPREIITYLGPEDIARFHANTIGGLER